MPTNASRLPQKPADLIMYLTILYETNRSAYFEDIQNISRTYGPRKIAELVKHVLKHSATYRNPYRILAAKQLFTTLQENAKPGTTDPIYVLNAHFRNLGFKNKNFRRV